MPLSAPVRARLAKAADDNGFDLPGLPQGDWLAFASSHAPVRIWLTAVNDGLLLAGISQPQVLRALADHGVPFTSPLPPGACGARGVTHFEHLHRMLRRAFFLSRTLPDELWKRFEGRTAALPRTTEAERWVIQRVGQDIFREGLLDYWDRRCAMTGLAVPDLLRASHIKPWADCERDEERLDVWNGLLLAPHLDAAFDGGWITVADDGEVLVAPALGRDDRRQLGLDVSLRVERLADGHRKYLPWHRERWRGR
ncbi:HNH endonuclease [Myxococcota bacterium]|nr:HNH endonuclease [Myxococcota bacterium]